jgi:hypothetical protein
MAREGLSLPMIGVADAEYRAVLEPLALLDT